MRFVLRNITRMCQAYSGSHASGSVPSLALQASVGLVIARHCA